MHAALVFEPGEGSAPGDFGDDLLVAAGRPFARRQHLDLPAARLRVFGVHAKQVAGEQRRLVAAGPGADFQDDVAFVVGVLGQQRDLDVAAHRLQRRLRLVGLRRRDLPHFRVERGIGEQGREIGALALLGAQRRDRLRQRLQLRVFAGNLGVLGAAGAGAQPMAELLVAAQNRVESAVEAHRGTAQSRTPCRSAISRRGSRSEP